MAGTVPRRPRDHTGSRRTHLAHVPLSRPQRIAQYLANGPGSPGPGIDGQRSARNFCLPRFGHARQYGGVSLRGPRLAGALDYAPHAPTSSRSARRARQFCALDRLGRSSEVHVSHNNGGHCNASGGARNPWRCRAPPSPAQAEVGAPRARARACAPRCTRRRSGPRSGTSGSRGSARRTPSPCDASPHNGRAQLDTCFFHKRRLCAAHARARRCAPLAPAHTRRRCMGERDGKPNN